MKLLIIASLFVSLGATAQVTSPLFTDSKGSIIKGKAYGNIVGSPYLVSDWTKGAIKTNSGKILREILLKYDIAGEKLLFQTSNGDSMYFAEPVIEFEIMPTGSSVPLKFTNGGPAGSEIQNKGFLQNISLGKINLYKKYNMSIIESKGYGSQSGDKSFNPSATYYLSKDGKLSKISPSKKSVLVLFPNKEKEISEYLKNNLINFKNDEDLRKLFDFLNQL